MPTSPWSRGRSTRPGGSTSRRRSTGPAAFGPIAQALDLPTIAVVPCPKWGDFHLTNLQDGVDAILLDELADPADFERLRHLVGLLARKPVIGAVESLPEVRRALAEVAPQDEAPAELIGPLAESFLRFADLAAIDELARSRPMPECCTRPAREPRPMRVAYALDDAFGGYFPDTFETLEALGAELVEFSPLRDGELPADVELVLIGCGFPDRFAETLASNQCLHAALKSHVCQGRRIYTEGGGTAYLGRSVILPEGRFQGVGILPIDSTLRTEWTPRRPSSRTPGSRRLARAPGDARPGLSIGVAGTSRPSTSTAIAGTATGRCPRRATSPSTTTPSVA